MAYNENPNPENLKKQEIELIAEEMREQRRSWVRSNITFIYIAAGVLVALLVFLLIRVYNNNTNPISRFISSSGKNLGSSYTFEVTAEKNGETQMSFSGAMKTNTGSQGVDIEYTADYSNYSYQNVVYTNGAVSYKGNYYDGQWTITDCSEKVQEFFDFYNDYKNGKFDGGSFLRFSGLNNRIYSIELNKFMDTIRSRLATDSSIAAITSTKSGKDTMYHYDINLEGLLKLIRERGAPVFYTLPDYNRFLNKLEANVERIQRSKCSIDFTVNSAGNMTDFVLLIDTATDEYKIICKFDNFGRTEPEIPEEFLDTIGVRTGN